MQMGAIPQDEKKNTMMKNKHITVIGGGLMGAGIAQVFAAKGHQVIIVEPNAESRATIHHRIRQNTDMMAIPPLPDELIKTVDTAKKAMSGSAFVFEAAPEKLELKQQIFAELEEYADKECIFASNTSVIPITKIGEKLSRPERLVGTHWWNPPFLIPLVEVVPSESTLPIYVDQVTDLLISVGKKAVKLKKDVPGFVGNRLQHALWREAHALIDKGICDAKTIDEVVKNSFGMRLGILGPIENADLVGIELTRDIHEVILPELSVATQPSPLLDQLISQNRLGFKTKSGFIDWTEEEITTLRKTLTNFLIKKTTDEN